MVVAIEGRRDNCAFAVDLVDSHFLILPLVLTGPDPGMCNGSM